MRSSPLVASLASLVMCLLVASATLADAASLHERSFEDASPEQLQERSMQGSLDSHALLALEKRQAALGGGGGAATTLTSIQSISGYVPPPSSRIPEPTPSAGTILSATDIPGYGNISQSGNLSSSAMSQNSSFAAFWATFMAVAMGAGGLWAVLM